MRRAQPRSAPPRLAYCGKAEVAAALGVSEDFVDDHVWRELRIVRRGRRCFVSVAELERWLERNAARVLGEEVA